jgi:hypothetical protein
MTEEKTLVGNVVDNTVAALDNARKLSNALDALYRQASSVRLIVEDLWNTCKSSDKELVAVPHQKFCSLVFAASLLGRRGSHIYVASKTKHARMWRDMRASGVPIGSSWLDADATGTTEDDMSVMWPHYLHDVATSRVVVAYHAPGETMKGALVELGAALVLNIPVYAVGIGDEYTIVRHPLVRRFDTAEEAIEAATKLLKR